MQNEELNNEKKIISRNLSYLGIIVGALSIITMIWFGIDTAKEWANRILRYIDNKFDWQFILFIIICLLILWVCNYILLKAIEFSFWLMRRLVNDVNPETVHINILYGFWLAIASDRFVYGDKEWEEMFVFHWVICLSFIILCRLVYQIIKIKYRQLGK